MFYLEGPEGEHTIRFKLYRDGVLISDSSETLYLYTGFWQKAWPFATLPGTYRLRVYIDGIWIGTAIGSSVTVTG